MTMLHPYYKPLTLCEVCAKACGRCPWSKKDVQQPVEGWDAIRNDVGLQEHRRGELRQRLCESYVVLACPLFELEERHRWAYERFDPELVRRKLAGKINTGLAMTKVRNHKEAELD